MRIIATMSFLILALLNGSVPVAAQGETAPAGSSAICIFEVSMAAHQKDASPNPVDPDQVLASLPDDWLDAAIRACGSLDDWLGAQALYPNVLGSSDRSALLLERCLEPTAGLDAYATCRSVVAALATPAPQGQPQPTPQAGETVAEQQPQEPYLGDRLTDRPKVRVSKDLKATIPGATKIRYFKIRGDTAAELLAASRSKARSTCREHESVGCVEFDWTAEADKQWDRKTGKCSMKAVRASLQAIVTMPRWVDRAEASPELRRWWRSVLLVSAEHEARHIEIQRKYIADFRREARGKPCGAANYYLTQQTSKAFTAQAALDELRSEPLPQYSGE